MNLRSSTFIRLLSVIGLFTSPALAQVYKLVDLGDLRPQRINESNQVVGLTWYGGDAYNSYVWQNGSATGIGALNAGGSTVANGINEAGKVVGYSWLASGPRHAFLWEHGAMTDLGTMGGSTSNATGINDSDHITGESVLPGDSITRGFIWVNGVMSDLGTLGGTFSSGHGINNSDQIAAAATLPAPTLNDEQWRAAIWQNGGMSNLGTLGGNLSDPFAINNPGHTVGLSTLDANGATGSFISIGGLVNLGAIGFPGGGAGGYALPYDLNDADEVVGSSSWDSPAGQEGSHAFLWRNGAMTDLNTVADTSGGWILIRATSINNHGDIVGLANVHGTIKGYLLTSGSIVLTQPRAGERWFSGEMEKIRWNSSLNPGEFVSLKYSIDDGLSWKTIANSRPADSNSYSWRVPDEFSSHARVSIAVLSDTSKKDIGGAFTIRRYVLTKLLAIGDDPIPYNFATDRWSFGNDTENVWSSSWYGRFDYTGTDPFTHKSYLSGGSYASSSFLTAHSSDFPDWPSWVKTFSIGNCYLNTSLSIYSPTAVAKWAAVRRAWGGSCVGFSISNAMAFGYPQAFQGRWATFPAFASATQVLPDTNVIPVINEIFTNQYGKPHTTYWVKYGYPKTPNETLNDLKTMLSSEYEPVRTLDILNTGPGGGGHSILAYKLMRDSVKPEFYHVRVYDNNYPNVANAEILIDTTQNGNNGSWSYSLSGWGGTYGINVRDPAIDYRNNPGFSKNHPDSRTAPFAIADTKVDIHVDAGSEVAIRDASGHISGYVDSLVQTGIPGSTPLIADNGSKTTPYGYELAFNPYSVIVSKFTDPESHEYFFTGNKTFSVERSGATGTQTDRLFFDGGLSLVNPDSVTKSVNIVNIISEDSPENVFSIGSLALAQNDSLRVENVAVDGLKLSSFSPAARTYRLDLESDGTSRRGHFLHDSLTLEGNSSHIIQPVWSAITNGVLKILVDLGNDGSIDDTLYVSAGVTGVREGGERGVPSAYVLHQNYPNPFNPITTISFELPRPAHLTLNIYDLFGREVATLVDGVQDAGFKSVEWNAAGAASGVYFYRLQAGDVILTRKLILMR